MQMIYIDPPYGIKNTRNFQPLCKRDVKDRADASTHLKQIKAFRDTWSRHSPYLIYFALLIGCYLREQVE